jgi:hypothetical protein
MLAALLLLTVPQGDVLEYSCDVQEINVVVDNDGEPRMVQVIFRDLAEIRDWRMADKCGMPNLDHATGLYVTRWIERGVLVEVKSPVLVETFTEEDRELDERCWLPDEQRKRINR